MFTTNLMTRGGMVNKLILLLLFPIIILAQATKLIDYGFEDYTGDVETTPGYIFTGSASTYWDDHLASTEVVSNCNGETAHSGTYYLHQNFYTGGTDACLGGAPSSVNDHGNVGLNSTYPTTGYGDNTQFSTDITSDTLVVRFYLRTQGNWASVSPAGNCKFTRTYGTGGGADNSSLITHYNTSANAVYIYDPSIISYGTGATLTTSLYNGNWHGMAVMIVINNHTNSSGNITASVWWDDYDMSGSPILTRTVTCPAWGSAFNYFDFWQNWSATYPTGSMGIDVDDIQVWDGFPTSGSTPDTTPPSGTVDITSTNATVTSRSSDTNYGRLAVSSTRYDTTSYSTYSGSTNIDSSITTSAGNTYYAYYYAVDDSGNITYFIENEDSVVIAAEEVAASGSLKAGGSGSIKAGGDGYIK